MSTPERPASSYYCRQCGTTSTDAGRCSQCHAESLEEIPVTTTTIENDEDFEQIFNSHLDLQAFTNLLLPMLMSQTPALRPSAARHRRARHPRRIKRAVQTHRQTPHVDLITSQIQFFPLDDFLPRPVLQPNVTLVQMPFQLLLFDSQRENINPELFAQLFNEDTGAVPLNRPEIDQLTPVNSEFPDRSCHARCIFSDVLTHICLQWLHRTCHCFPRVRSVWTISRRLPTLNSYPRVIMRFIRLVWRNGCCAMAIVRCVDLWSHRGIEHHWTILGCIKWSFKAWDLVKNRRIESSSIRRSKRSHFHR